MKDVTSSLGKCTKLVVIDFFNCNIVEIAAELGDLTSLQRLDLANNYITQLPHEFLGLKSLRYLNLNNNNITTLPVRCHILLIICKFKIFKLMTNEKVFITGPRSVFFAVSYREICGCLS